MALTPSNMLALGTQAPGFKLDNVMDGQQISFQDVKGPAGTLVMFICVHCPYVIHVESEIKKLTSQYLKRGLGVVAISSNDIEKYPQDGPAKMVEQIKKNDFEFPYLYDKDQLVAKTYDAACTPDFYLFDGQDTLVYRGRLDESRPGNELPLTGADLRAAIDAMLQGEKVDQVQYPSMGCNIKWK